MISNQIIENNEKMNWDESMELITMYVGGSVHSRLFGLVLKYSICDILEEKGICEVQGKHFSEISKLIGFNDESSCYRLLRYFVPFGLFNEIKKGYFLKTKSSTQFSNNGNLKRLGLFYTHDSQYKFFESISSTLENGKSAGPSSMGLNSFWDVFEKDLIPLKLFNDAMKDYSTLMVSELKSNLNLSNFKIAIDIGGSHGLVIGSLLESNPNLIGINFDLPSSLSSLEASKSLFQHSRLTHIGGNFFESVPEGDCYLLKYILHDWTDDECCLILNTISKSMLPNAKLFIIDIILNDSSDYNRHDVQKDVLMMHYFNAKERTKSQWIQLFDRANFKIDSIITNIKPQILIVSKK